MEGLLDRKVALQIQALRGLIEASEKLGLDSTRYKNALQAIRPDLGEKPSVKKTARKIEEKKAPRVKVLPGASRLVRKTRVKSGRLDIYFDAPLAKEGVRTLRLKRDKRLLYVFDIWPARYPYHPKHIKGKGFREIRIAQFAPKKVRVVVETDKRYDPIVRWEGDRLTISLPDTVVTPSKEVSNVEKMPTPRKTMPAKHTPDLSFMGFKRYTVVIDPGHGGKDTGAIGYHRLREKDAVLAIGKALRDILKKRGFRVYMTRQTNIFIPLKRRTRYANRKQADFFVSIHANAAPKRGSFTTHKGVETYFLSPARSGRAKRIAAIENRAEIKNIDQYTKNAYLSVLNREKIIESNKLAIDIQKQVLAALRSRYKGVVDGGVREGPFWVLVGAQMPAVLIETGYITNPTEAKRLFNRNYQRKMAEGIANGIESYIYHNQ